MKSRVCFLSSMGSASLNQKGRYATDEGQRCSIRSIEIKVFTKQKQKEQNYYSKDCSEITF